MAARRETHLTLHGVGVPPPGSDPGVARFWIPVDLCLQVLDLVAGRPDVNVSVDDGNASDVEIVAPALAERGMVAGFFPVVNWLDAPGFMSAAEVASLAEAGMPIGVHGMTHRPWRSCPPEALRHELADARVALSEITDRAVDTAACPLGAYDRRALRELRGQGFATVYTSDRATATPGSWLRPRFSLTDQDTLESVRDLLSPTPPIRRVRDAARILAKRLR